ncbi:MAG: glutaredoxin family protein [Nesterenkonia sp.]|uniref:glutaredoxin family protein n=1 Tax=Nesterenkonia marinintestina TaxID=2979865 RepID=UPI0021C05A85|nr:glutaredoxin family protein [Nesterenkonia sp. GX14115]MDO5493145.1 glutaredoxin family protein [Nesterenkonia sp.]
MTAAEPPRTEPHIEVLTKHGCHLCEQMLVTAGEVAAEFGLSVTQVDITHDAQALARFAEELPVLRIDGAVRDFWRVDPQRMRRLLTEAGA